MDINTMIFKSPTHGELSFSDTLLKINDYIKEEPSKKYNIMVGTDSQSRFNTKVVIVICVCREGKGGKYFYFVETIKKIKDLRTKIYYETKLSIDISKAINDNMFDNNIDYSFSIHADIGKNGPTSKLINEIVGWIEGEGFVCHIKPNSYVASSIADRISK